MPKGSAEQEHLTEAPEKTSGFQALVNRLEGGKSFYKWAEQCVYKCQVDECQYSCHSHSHLSQHLKRTHNMTSILAYNQKYGLKTALTTEKRHQCLICQRQVIHTYAGIKNHSKLQHGLDCGTYYKDYILKDNGDQTKQVKTEDFLTEDIGNNTRMDLSVGHEAKG